MCVSAWQSHAHTHTWEEPRQVDAGRFLTRIQRMLRRKKRIKKSKKGMLRENGAQASKYSSAKYVKVSEVR